MVKEKKATLSKDPIYTNRIHIEDAARILVHLMQLENPDSLYLGVDSSPSAKNEVISFIAEKLGAELSQIKDTGNSPMRSNKRCSNKKILESGFSFLYPSYKEGYSELL